MSGLGALFSGPKQQPVVRMPDEQNQAAIDARRRNTAKQVAATGRQSTNLTGGTAAPAYLNDTLGS